MLRSSSRDAQACARTASYTTGTSPTESEFHSQGTDASGTEWLNYTQRLKPKDMVPTPWMVAMALQADGWWLRSDVIWSKANPLPESVTDRPSKAHEYVLLLTKSFRYFFDQEAVREPAEWNRWGDQTNRKYEGSNSAAGWISNKTREELNANRSSYKPGQTTGNTLDGHAAKSDAGLTVNPAGRNIRSVWSIATQPYADAHFAVFPEALPDRCIRAGCPPGGVVLDPFIGSGTTAVVARRLGRRCVGIELNEEYAALCVRRVSQWWRTPARAAVVSADQTSLFDVADA